MLHIDQSMLQCIGHRLCYRMHVQFMPQAGSVGNISASAFQQGQDYNWGLFSYIYKDQAGGQTFEVLNYWVD